MLVVIPDIPAGRLGALLCALIVVSTVIGLSMHRDFYAGKRRKDFLCFYTNLSNLLVFVYFALISPHLYARQRLHALIPHAEFAIMMCIMLTFSVFHLLLFPAVRRQVASMAHTPAYRLVCVDNFIIHYLVPWLVFFYWLLCSPGKERLSPRDAFIWTALPLGYVLCIFMRASRGGFIEETQSPYPYPFLDIRVFGAKRVTAYCALLYACCAAAGLGLIALVHLLAA